MSRQKGDYQISLEFLSKVYLWVISRCGEWLVHLCMWKHLSPHHIAFTFMFNRVCTRSMFIFCLNSILSDFFSVFWQTPWAKIAMLLNAYSILILSNVNLSRFYVLGCLTETPSICVFKNQAPYNLTGEVFLLQPIQINTT